MCARWSWLVLNPNLEEPILDVQKTMGISAVDLGISVVCPDRSDIHEVVVLVVSGHIIHMVG